MVQRMIDYKNFESKLKKFKSIGIQTGDENERCITISDTKKNTTILFKVIQELYC